MSELSRVDPDWAWQAFSPSDASPWDTRRVTHLFRRAGFGITPEQIDEMLERSPQEAVASTMSSPPDERPPYDKLAQTILGGGDASRLSAWWLYVMLHEQAQYREKLTLFWHGHFATSLAKVQDAQLMYKQNRLFRRHCDGHFPSMVAEVSRDPAMLIYLDSVSNRKSHPNENYARELLELFCLGEGAYSERDIRELARCFTGWEIRRGRFRFNRYRHDTGVKAILGHEGTFPDGQAIEVIVDQPAAASFIAEKLIRYYVTDESIIPPRLVQPIAEELRKQDWQLAPAIQRILESRLFFSELAIGRKIRSPIELTVGFLRTVNGSTDTVRLAEDLENLGQALFFPPNVKGWDGGKTWINTSRLLSRVNAMRRLIDHSKTRFDGKTIKDYFADREIRRAEQVINHLEQTGFAVRIPLPIKTQLAQDYGGRDLSDRDLKRVLFSLFVLPEYQLC